MYAIRSYYDVIHEVPVVVVTHSHEGYIDDFSLIVKRFMQMENLNVIFALASMAGRLYLICRSRISEVNVGAIARELGGNGHASAAAATRITSYNVCYTKLLRALISLKKSPDSCCTISAVKTLDTETLSFFEQYSESYNFV